MEAWALLSLLPRGRRTGRAESLLLPKEVSARQSPPQAEPDRRARVHLG